MPESNVVELWFHYEEVAMHFNELIIQFRLQLLGGAGAVATVATYLIESKASPPDKRLLRAFVATVFFLVVAAAAYLDIFYYNQLLEAAVDVIVDFEKKHPQIYMSTHIQDVVGNDTNVMRNIYFSALVGLALFSAWSWWRFATAPASERGARGRREADR
jgi:hypothetical protein